MRFANNVGNAGPHVRQTFLNETSAWALFARLYVTVGILLTCRKHLHDRIISQRREI
jgi:hypothetical protein